MPVDVIDYRTDVRNFFIAPEMRARIIRREPGTAGDAHTHDLGHEVFLILEGKAEITIEDDTAILGPGECCVVRANQWHQVRVVGETPLTYYLSVTPHIEPTHTHWDRRGGEQLPYRYGESTRAERRARTEPPAAPETLLAEYRAAAHALAETAETNAAADAAPLRAALESGDRTAARAALDALSPAVRTTYQRLSAMADAWNELAAEVGSR